MRWVIAPLLGQVLLAVPSHAQVDSVVHERCKSATDYQGCVKSQSSAVADPVQPSRLVFDEEKIKSYSSKVRWDGGSCPEGKMMAYKNEYGFFGGLKKQIPVGCMTPYEVEMINATEKAGRKPVTYPVPSSPKSCRTQVIGTQAFTTCY